MSRITDDERNRFHNYIDYAIDKLNNDKNRNKPHWLEETTVKLSDMITVESAELNLAVRHGSENEIKNECYDLINLSLMIIDEMEIFGY